MRLSQLTQEDAKRLNAVLGSVPDLTEGEILKFNDAVLARAEVNKNQDGIDGEGLRELAQTLPLMPLDDEHVADKVIGFFTNAAVAGDALLTDGIIYAARFPEVTRDIVDGHKHLSVEAYGASARCSVCHEVFASPRDYCTHLTNRASSGAVRWLSGLRAIGGGAVRRNAGTDTTFDKNRFVLLASLAEDESPIVADQVEDEAQAPESMLVAQENEGDKEAMDELEKTLAETQALLAQREQELQAALARENELVAQHTADILALKRTYARKAEMLAAGFADAAVNALEAKIATVDDDVFGLLLETGKRTVAVVVAEPNSVVAAEVVEPQPHAVMAGTRVADNADPFAIFK